MLNGIEAQNFWKNHLQQARTNLNREVDDPAWTSEYLNQVLMTDADLINLGITPDTLPKNIPAINEVQNPKSINAAAINIIEIGGMPGTAKDTYLKWINDLKLPDVVCSAEEGYAWSNLIDPLSGAKIHDLQAHGAKGEEIVQLQDMQILHRHFQAYGGTDMEIEELIDLLSYGQTQPHGVALLNRSHSDNYWAFGSSFFLRGFLGLDSLRTSEKMFEFFQYHPSLRIGKKMKSVEEVTAGRFIFMAEPKTSLERISRRGRILNEEFLTLLYSQYLRMISKLRFIEQPNLVVLDMSGPVEENKELFKSKLAEIGVFLD